MINPADDDENAILKVIEPRALHACDGITHHAIQFLQ
jgi:hypothetical protein